jgi:hypothetical protein
MSKRTSRKPQRGASGGRSERVAAETEAHVINHGAKAARDSDVAQAATSRDAASSEPRSKPTRPQSDRGTAEGKPRAKPAPDHDADERDDNARVRTSGPRLPSRPAPIFDWFARWLGEPQPIERLAIVRVLAPLAIIGFMSGRAAHAGEWLGNDGFRVPDHAGDWRQPVYLPGLPDALAWGVAGALLVSAVLLAIGYRTRLAAIVLSATLVYVALADRLAAFTVSKISPAIALALALAPSGARYSIDALRAARTKRQAPRPTLVSGGVIRFFQAFLAVFYASSGICKARGDWLKSGLVLWTHVHDSYQTSISYALARIVPGFAWTLLQGIVLVFELFAPIWFAMERTRVVALVVGVTMHTMIGLMFGPVRWFSMLMITLLLGAYLPERGIDWLRTRIARAARVFERPPSAEARQEP